MAPSSKSSASTAKEVPGIDDYPLLLANGSTNSPCRAAATGSKNDACEAFRRSALPPQAEHERLLAHHCGTGLRGLDARRLRRCRAPKDCMIALSHSRAGLRP